MKKYLVIMFLIVIATAVVGCKSKTGKEDNTDAVNVVEEDIKESDTIDENDKTEQEKGKENIEEEEYNGIREVENSPIYYYLDREESMVGEEIQAGEYIARNSGRRLYGEILVYKDSKTSEPIMKAEVTLNSQIILTLEEGDIIYGSDLSLWGVTPDLELIDTDEFLVREGIYKAGIQIPKGKYTVTGNKNAKGPQ